MIGSIEYLKNIIYSDSILSVVYSADRFFYAIFDNHHCLVHSSLEPIDKADLADLISRGFKKKILAVDGVSLHLPKGVEAETLLDHYTYALPNCEKHSEQMLGVEAETHYLLHQREEETLTAFFETSEFTHLSTVITSYLYPALKDKVMLLGGDEYLYIAVMGAEGLKMVNRYSCNSPEDYLYYVNLCFSKLDLKPDKTSLEIAGRIDQDGEIFKNLTRYFGNAFISDPILFQTPDNHMVKSHYFMDHYMSYLCVL